MKKYVYHVSYYHKGTRNTLVGDCTATLSAPLTNLQAFERLRESILDTFDDRGTLVLFNVQLLYVEDLDE